MGEKWASLTQEEEDLHRQTLFRKARKSRRNYKKSTACDFGQRKSGRSWSMTLPKAGNGRLGKRDR